MSKRFHIASRTAAAIRRAGSRFALRARWVRRRFRSRLSVRQVPGLVLVGHPSTGWVVPVAVIRPGWTCYSVGIGEDTSFDVALVNMGCRVVAIDPTPRAGAHIAPLLARYRRLRFLPYAVWSADTEVPFYAPQHPEYVSHSILNLHGKAPALTVPARTIASIATELGDERVELLKLDIEGAETEVLRTTDFVALGTMVICVECHDHLGLAGMLDSVEALEQKGFVAVHVRRTDVTFVSDAVL